MFTGSCNPKCLCASRTLIHPRTGPLSSEEPLPIKRPVDSSMKSLKGSVFQPSDNSACDHKLVRLLVTGAFMDACRLNIKVAIDENSLLLWIASDSSKQCRRKLQGLPIHLVLPKIDLFCFYSYSFEFIIQPICHFHNVRSTGGVSADAASIRSWVSNGQTSSIKFKYRCTLVSPPHRPIAV